MSCAVKRLGRRQAAHSFGSALGRSSNRRSPRSTSALGRSRAARKRRAESSSTAKLVRSRRTCSASRSAARRTNSLSVSPWALAAASSSARSSSVTRISIRRVLEAIQRLYGICRTPNICVHLADLARSRRAGAVEGALVAAAFDQGINRGINLSESERTSDHRNPANARVSRANKNPRWWPDNSPGLTGRPGGLFRCCSLWS